ncbi:LysR family transcriptional regulator (plasmid) [Sinorhizobium meliloti]|nr:LysR family transcriptional regulator [Sinorhizobium meliloti]
MRGRPTVLDLDCLRTFVTIVDTGSFSNAAGAVARTPSAVSMQIKKLEEHLGVSLFDRDSRSVALTRDGEKLLPRARQILSLSNEAVARFVMPDLQGKVKFGAPHDLAERVLPSILRNLESNFPSITVDVTADTSDGLLRRARSGHLDLAIINFAKGSRNPPGELLAEENTVWVGARGGVAYRRDPLPLSLYGNGCIWRAAAVAQLEKQGRNYRTAYLSTHAMPQRAAITSDLAIAPLPASYVTEDMVILGEDEGFPKLDAFEIRLVVGAEATPAVRTIRDLVKATFEK